MPPMALIIGGVLFVAVVLLLLSSRGRKGGGEGDIADRLAQFAERPMTLEEIELQRPFSERVVAPFVAKLSDFIGRRMPKQSMERLRHRLETAGNPGNLQPGAFMVLQWVVTAVVGVLGIFLFRSQDAAPRFLYTLMMVLFGYFLPVMWLNQNISRRQGEILKALPDAIDLLTISVEAGLGFDLAMQRVVEKWDNELALEFERVLSDIRLGKKRRDALRELIGRTGVPDLSTFVAAVIQADQLGVSIAKILRVQSDQMRIRRRQRAEELAHQAPVKMLFPMVFLIFPSMFVVILGPAVPLILKAFVKE
ncbi:MAG: type II secretion system F family protein [Chloroflexia bacterium]|nr:type II secretion system F family protein [Chloroflexia bacterium]